jgi:hypothetical protein
LSPTFFRSIDSLGDAQRRSDETVAERGELTLVASRDAAMRFE